MGATASHELHGLLTVHMQLLSPEVMVTVTDWLPPLAPGFQPVGLRVKVPLPAAWLTVKVWPAMVRLQVLGAQAVLVRTVTFTVPGPLPLGGVAITQLLHGLVTLQAQLTPVPAKTVTDSEPPRADGLKPAGLIANAGNTLITSEPVAPL
jgi:hypothetical protein